MWYNCIWSRNEFNCVWEPPTLSQAPAIHRVADLLKTVANIVHWYTFCITYNKDLYVSLNRGYLFALRHNLRQWTLDTHKCNKIWNINAFYFKNRCTIFISLLAVFIKKSNQIFTRLQFLKSIPSEYMNSVSIWNFIFLITSVPHCFLLCSLIRK
jgi:hypothetical protein